MDERAITYRVSQILTRLKEIRLDNAKLGPSDGRVEEHARLSEEIRELRRMSGRGRAAPEGDES